MPVYDVSDELSLVVNADRQRTWDALINVDFIAVGKKHPLAALLGAVRMLPEIVAGSLHGGGDAHDGDGTKPQSAPREMRLKDFTDPEIAGPATWVMLGEREGTEIALGLVGKFWKPVIEFARVAPEDFAGFDTPGFARTIYGFGLTPVDEAHTKLTAVMRTATTDAHARRWFRRYWLLGIESGAHVLVNGLLEMVSTEAEVNAIKET
jgi:hypothetical protein